MTVRYSPPGSASQSEAEPQGLDLEISTPAGDVVIEREVPIIFSWTRPVNGFTEDAPSVRSFGPGGEELEPGQQRIAYLSHFSGNDGDRVYTARLNLPPSAIGQIEIFVGTEVATLAVDESVAGPPAPRTLTLEYNTRRTVQAPGVSIVVPTVEHFGTSYRLRFIWTEPVNGFAITDIVLSDTNLMLTDFEQVDFEGEIYEATVHFDSNTMGSLTVTVPENAAQGEHARGPATDVSETFMYNATNAQDRTLTGATVIADLTKELSTLVDGLFAGVLETLYHDGFLYILAQVIPSRQSTPNNFPNEDVQAGAELWRLRISRPQWQLIKSWNLITTAARSLCVHDNAVHFFEGHYLAYQVNDRVDTEVIYNVQADMNERLRTYAWKEDIGKVYRITGTSVVEVGQSFRSAFVNPDDEEAVRDAYYGIHGGMIAPMLSVPDSLGTNTLNLISGHGDLRNINDITDDVSSTDNWQWLEYTRTLSSRLSLLDTQKTGWQHIQDIAVATASTIGFEPDGTFFFKPRGAKVAKTVSAITETDTSVGITELRNLLIPTRGLVRIDQEVLSYTLSGTTLTFTARGQHDTEAAQHTIGSQVTFIDRAITLNQSMLKQDIDDIVFHSNTEWFYNVIEIRHGENGVEIARDDDSVDAVGERRLQKQTILSDYDVQWAKWLAERYLAEFSRNREVTQLEMELNKDIYPTQTLYLYIHDRTYFAETVHVVEVNHNLIEQTSTLTLLTE